MLFFSIGLLVLTLNANAFSKDSTLFQKRIDSIQRLINKPTNDTAKISLLIAIAKEYETKDKHEAFLNANKAYELAQKTNDKNKIGQCLNYLGDLNWFTGDYANSSDYYFKALKIYEGLNNKAGIAECYRNIGWIYLGQGLYKQTIDYYTKSLEINTALGLKSKMIANYDDIGIVKKLQGNFPEAIKYCMQTIKLSEETNSTKGKAIGYGNLANTYVAMKQYDLAIENFMLGIKYHKEISDHFNSAEGTFGLADCYFKIGNHFKAIEYAEQSAAIANKFDYKTIASDNYKLLANINSLRKDYVNAYKYLQLYTLLRDSTYNEKNSRQINEMSAKYESEKKELMISSLEKDKTLSEEKSEQDKKFRIYMIIFCLMIIVIAVVLFRSNIQKKRNNTSLSLAYKEIEVKNKDITDSINYAKHIQRARLTNPSVILKHMPEVFGLYKPKDVVSGDFYWFAEHENGKLLIAAADCTGHGIPGAFMSLIGIDELNHAALEKRLSHTSSILSSVNKGLKKALRQNEQNSMSRDGMDIALCIFDLKNLTLEYAGANRPLYYIRENKLHEIAPTKVAIGGYTENDQEFKSHTIAIKKNDMIYIFTDGYADQFGGENGKKFMTKRFKELLLEIHTKPVADQESILETALNEWKKGISQVDDILVLGIRV